ncbi:MAG: class I SAM-dependent methyltransferase [Gammaproteobacteria bacterium]
MRHLLLTFVLVGIAGCGVVTERFSKKAMKPDSTRLEAVLAAQSDETKARYDARNPGKTLEFFGIAPGMTVVEGLPGGGWYSRILIDYVGPDGALIGADYAFSMWPKFGFFDEAAIKAKETWATDWPQQAQEWRSEQSAPITGFAFGAMPKSMHNTADAAIYVRAMHNLARFENDGGYLTQALRDTFNVLKPGGIVGIVQHEARDTMSDEFAQGGRGYLKKSFVIETMRSAGFEYVGSRDFNANSKDRPGEDDIVWRLPPSLSTSRDNPALRDELLAIGESNRMTLKFRKPRNP